MDVTLSGMLKLLSLSQLLNVPLLIELIPSGSVIESRLTQLLNAELPTDTTLFGIEMLDTKLQPENAESPIIVTGFPTIDSGIITAPKKLVGKSVISM